METSLHKLTRKVAIVTGASAGYGSGIATKLVEAGCVVYATGRNKDRLEAACMKSGAIPFVADASSAEAWGVLVQKVSSEQGKIDILVNNAGSGGKIGPLDELSPEEACDVLRTNLNSVIFGSQTVVPIMLRNGAGMVVNISSVCARYSWPGWAVYSAAKAGVERFTKSFYAEYRERGIRATTLLPSWGATDFADSSAIDGHPSQQADIKAKCTRPEELGDAVVHICGTPSHLNLLEYSLIPTVQCIEPL